MRIASFDIGKKNLALYVEDFDPSELKQIERVLIKNRFDSKRTPKKEFREMLDKLYLTGRCCFLDVFDVSCGSKGHYIPPETYHQIISILEDHSRIFDDCEIIIFEEQLAKKNVMATKIAQHIYTWFMVKYGPFRVISPFPASSRNRTLGCQKKLSDRKRKTWASKEGKRLVKLRKDKKMERMFLIHSDKNDDLGDAILDAKAYQLRVFIDGLNI